MKSVIIASSLMGAALAAPSVVSPRAGCSETFDGPFEITIADVTVTKRDLQVCLRESSNALFGASY